MTAMAAATDRLREDVVGSFGGCANPRLRVVLQALVRHLHEFVAEVGLTEDEWRRAIEVLTETGQMCDQNRQEFVLWSDALGVSTLIDALAHPAPDGVTESALRGPFWVADSPWREYGDSIAEQPAGEPAWVHGRILDTAGAAVPDAAIDVWQNGADSRYGIQDPAAPPGQLRGQFRSRHDGRYAFLGTRPTPYRIPDDGPVGRMLKATGRDSWRPGHIHLIVTAAGHRPVTTQIFDANSEHLDADAVFAVKPSLLRTFTRHAADDPVTPTGVTTDWYELEYDIVLARQP